MQLIEPQERVGVGPIIPLDTGRLVDITMILVPPHALTARRHARAVQVLGRSIIDIRNQAVGVEQREAGTRIPVRHQLLERRLVPEHGVDRGGVFVHCLGDLGQVLRFLRPVLIVADAV